MVLQCFEQKSIFWCESFNNKVHQSVQSFHFYLPRFYLVQFTGVAVQFLAAKDSEELKKVSNIYYHIMRIFKIYIIIFDPLIFKTFIKCSYAMQKIVFYKLIGLVFVL